jgi:VWFA-related protein
MRGLLAAIALTWLVVPRPSAQSVFRSSTTGVEVDVRVRDKGRPVASLTLADFELRDNGVLQRIDDVSIADLPVDVTLVLDSSGSVEGISEEMTRARRDFTRLLRDDDRLRVLTIDTVPGGAPDFRSPSQALRSAIDPQTQGGTSSVYDTLAIALVHTPEVGRRGMVIVFTDGIDNRSAIDARRLIEVARVSENVLYFVSTTPTPGHAARLAEPVILPGADGLAALKRASDDTGGRLVSGGTLGKSLVPFFRDALDDFRTRYVLRYSPRGVDATGWHALEVKLRATPWYEVRARSGYAG